MLVSIATGQMSLCVALFSSFQRRCRKSGNLSSSRTSGPDQDHHQEWVMKVKNEKQTDLRAGGAREAAVQLGPYLHQLQAWVDTAVRAQGGQ